MIIENRGTHFVIGRDKFQDLEIRPGSGAFHYFYDKKHSRLIKDFVLKDGDRVRYLCQVTLIKQGERFTPRLAVRTENKSRTATAKAEPIEETTREIKALVNLGECHSEFWELISFIGSFHDIDVPTGSFSLISKAEAEIVASLLNRAPTSLISIIKQLSTNVELSPQDVNHILRRKQKLGEFERALEQRPDERFWQEFFQRNTWIFGYGLNYQILNQCQSQPHYGAVRLNGRAGEKGDFLASTAGDLNFTVIVEIKTPLTPLLRGNTEIRSGAWSLSKDLTDAISQIQANVATWEKDGSEQHANRDMLESNLIYTVQPKGIIVIGSLKQLREDRTKRETFQRFRRSIHGIEIITFDELHRRATYIVGHTS
jgi:hypothetical protein